MRLVQSGKRVCRLKGGDPLVFGRGGEELEALAAAGLRFQVVPGVSAAEGCAAYAGIPLTLRGVAQAVLLTTGHTQDERGAVLSEFRPGQTLALYMGVAQYAEIAAALIAHGHDPDTPVAVVESGTTASSVVRTALRSLAGQARPSPARRRGRDAALRRALRCSSQSSRGWHRVSRTRARVLLN